MLQTFGAPKSKPESSDKNSTCSDVLCFFAKGLAKQKITGSVNEDNERLKEETSDPEGKNDDGDRLKEDQDEEESRAGSGGWEAENCLFERSE